jgi:hypothetical protein
MLIFFSKYLFNFFLTLAKPRTRDNCEQDEYYSIHSTILVVVLISSNLNYYHHGKKNYGTGGVLVNSETHSSIAASAFMRTNNGQLAR